MSMPLRRDRPLWEMWICEEPQNERFAIVGKAHHCMVDGIAAVELGSLLLDPTPEPVACEPRELVSRSRSPAAERLLVRGARDLLGQQLGLLRGPLRAATSPTRAARQTASAALRVTRALSHSLRERRAGERAQRSALAVAAPGVDRAAARRPADRQAQPTAQRSTT